MVLVYTLKTIYSHPSAFKLEEVNGRNMCHTWSKNGIPSFVVTLLLCSPKSQVSVC